MEVTCPNGHTSEIMDPTTDEQLVGVDVEGADQFGVVTVAAIAVECPECHEHFEHEIED